MNFATTPFLRSTIACAIALARLGQLGVMEFGGGTGVITQAILDTGISPDSLIVFERDSRFYRHLKDRFPNVRIFYADATKAEEILKSAKVGKISAVVSGLPLLTMPNEAVKAILEASFSLLGNYGSFVQFTYGIRSPVSKFFVQALSLQSEIFKNVWLNIPPATIWRYSLRENKAVDSE